MSLSWVTVEGGANLPPLVLPDERFTAFPGITSQLSSFEPVNGVLHLSQYRVVFLQAPREREAMNSIPLKQVSIPLHRWLNPTVGQPWFGPNYYEGEVNPSPGGGLQLGGGIVLKAKFIFNEGGIERFHKMFQQVFIAASLRHQQRSATNQQDEPLPLYQDPGEGSGVPPEYV